MGISRDSRHKRRSTGGRKANLKKKRQYESGRPAAMTKLGLTKIHDLRVRGGNKKFRAMRLDHGSFRYIKIRFLICFYFIGVSYSTFLGYLDMISTHYAIVLLPVYIQ